MAGVTFQTVQRIALSLPEVEEGTSYGTPAFKVRKKLFARLREEGDVLVVKTGFLERESLIQAQPDVFYFTDHYAAYPWILIRLPHIDEEQLREMLTVAWRLTAPAKLVAGFDADRQTSG